MPITLQDIFSIAQNVGEQNRKEQQAAKDLENLKAMHDQYGDNVSVKSGDYGIGAKDPLMALLRKQQIDEIQQARENTQVEKLQDDVTKSGAAQALQSLERVNKQIPGILQGKAQFKSVGGAKNLIPNIAVPIAEKFGVLPSGSGNERAALQDMQNTKIYDSSGKQINESEMKRISQSMGLGGVFDPSATNQATKQIADTVLQKNRNITAGYRPQTVKTFKDRGGITTDALETLIKGTSANAADTAPVSPSSMQGPSDAQTQRYLELKKKYGR